MKRFLAVLLAVLMLSLPLAGCGESPAPETPQPPAPVEPAEPPEPPVPLEGEYIPLATKTPEKWLCAALEFEDRFLMIYRDGSSEAFSLKDGALLSENAPMEGTLLGAEKSQEKAGYDYVLRFFDRLVWKNSRQPEKALEEPLPFECPEETPEFSSQNPNGYYDIGETYLLYAAPDGIHRALRDGSEDILLLKNAELPPLGELWSQYDPDMTEETIENLNFPVSYVEPRLILNESKVAAAIWSPDRDTTSCFVCDIETGEVEHTVWWHEPWTCTYPWNDRYIAVRGDIQTEITDAETGETKIIKNQFNTRWYTTLSVDPFCAVVQWTTDIGDWTHFKAVITHDLKTADAPFIRVTDDITSGGLCGATEHYVLLNLWIGRNENVRIFLVPMPE